MTVAIVAIVCALIGAGGAIWAAFIARGVKRSSRQPQQQITDLQFDVLALKRHIFKLQTMLAERGARPPEMPRLRSVSEDMQ